MNRLKGKLCLVTGAGSGIGWETSRKFAEQGAIVHAIDIESSGLESIDQISENIHTHLADITDIKQIQSILDGFDRIDVLFNCAGRVDTGNILACSENDWSMSMSLNVTAIFRLTQAVLPIMLRQGSGSIINMASVISSIGGAPDRFAYGATKGAVIGMTKSIAKDFANQGIRCNAICPSAVETPSMTQRIESMEDPNSARATFNQRQPVGRMGTPEEIAHLATYLASDESKFMTGSAIVIDGGAKI